MTEMSQRKKQLFANVMQRYEPSR